MVLRLKITDVDNYEMKEIADVDMNGQVDILDVTLLQRYLTGLRELTPEQLMYADVNDDGDADIIDATVLQRYDIGLDVLTQG